MRAWFKEKLNNTDITTSCKRTYLNMSSSNGFYSGSLDAFIIFELAILFLLERRHVFAFANHCFGKIKKRRL